MSFEGKMEPVLVVGGSGALGCHIVNQLIDEHNVTEIYVFDTHVNPPLRHTKATYIQGSLTSREDVFRAVQKVKPKLTFHTASPRLMGFADAKILDDVNVQGTQNLIDALLEQSDISGLVYTGSSSVVHNNYTDLVNVTEELPYCLEPEQQEHYSHTKAIAEIMVKEANLKSNLMTVVIRASILFGEGDNTFTPTSVTNVLAGRAKLQIGDGKNLQDFTYLGNSAYAHILAGKLLLKEAAQGGNLKLIPATEKVNGETFVVTNDEPWPFWDITRAVAKVAGRPVKPEDVWIIPVTAYYLLMVISEWSVWLFSLGQRTSRFNRKMVKFLTMTRTFDITKAKTRLGYAPRVSMQDGLERAVKWYMEHNNIKIQ